MEKEHVDFYNSLNETLSGDGIADNAKHNLFESPEAEEKDRPEQKRSRPSKSARLEQERQQLLNELNEQKRLINEMRKAALEKDESTLELVNTNIKFAKMTAEAENDLKAKTEAEDALMELKLKKYQLQQQKEELNRYVPQQHAQHQYVNSEADENYREFLERNPFINHFDQSNPNFSQEAYNLTQKLSSRLSMQYKRQGRGDEEFSQAYFEDLENMMNSELGGGEPTMENNRRNSFSAPVNSYQAKQKQRNMTLSAEEQRTFDGFMNNAINDQHREMIRKRFLNAKKRNYESPNIYKI